MADRLYTVYRVSSSNGKVTKFVLYFKINLERLVERHIKNDGKSRSHFWV